MLRTSEGWTGSALLGGFLSDERGYGFSFMITAIIQLIGTWIMFPLIALVPIEEAKSTNHEEGGVNGAAP